jgi:hypothetical protein
LEGWVSGVGIVSRGEGPGRRISAFWNPEGLEAAVMDEMKDQYDFSKGVRGKFYVAEDEIRLPRYLSCSTVTPVQVPLGGWAA